MIVMYEGVSKIFRTYIVKIINLTTKRVWKLPTSTQLRAAWHTDSVDTIVLPSTGVLRYQNCCIDGGTSPEYFGYTLVGVDMTTATANVIIRIVTVIGCMKFYSVIRYLAFSKGGGLSCCCLSYFLYISVSCLCYSISGLSSFTYRIESSINFYFEMLDECTKTYAVFAF
jgi:hypothetical protein